MGNNLLYEGFCPRCGSEKVSVIRSVHPRRERVCKVCGNHFPTLEVVVLSETVGRRFVADLLAAGSVSIGESLTLIGLSNK